MVESDISNAVEDVWGSFDATGLTYDQFVESTEPLIRDAIKRAAVGIALDVPVELHFFQQDDGSAYCEASVFGDADDVTYAEVTSAQRFPVE